MVNACVTVFATMIPLAGWHYKLERLLDYRDPAIETSVLAGREGVLIHLSPSADAKIVGELFFGDVVRVRAVRGSWLRTQIGWIERSQVVGDREAIEWFTKRIDESPSAASYIGPRISLRDGA